MTNHNALAPEALGPTVTAGEVLVEIMATTTGHGFLEPQNLSGPFPSGAPAIFISQVARFGAGAGIISAVGRDDFGALNVARLEADGVDTSAITVSSHRPTGSAFVRYRPDGSRDFIFNIAHSAAGETSIGQAANALLAKAGHLHIMGSTLAIPGLGANLVQAAEALKQRGGSVSLDPNIRKELLQDGGLTTQLDAILSLTDLLLPSGEELTIISGERDETTAIKSLLARGIHEVVLKRGKQGSAYFSEDRAPVFSPAFMVEEIDPTGAGDCFGAAYLTCRRLAMSVEQSLTYANAAGACAVMRLGPMEGVATRQELDRFILQQDRSVA